MALTQRLITAIAAAIIFGSVPDPTWAQYLKMKDIKGESRDAGHKDWIDLLSVSTPLNRASTPSGRGDIVVVKQVDKATPKLKEAIAKGKVFPSVVLSVPARGQTGYYEVTLKRVLVSSYSVSGSGRAATETISLIYEEIEWE